MAGYQVTIKLKTVEKEKSANIITLFHLRHFISLEIIFVKSCNQKQRSLLDTC